MIQNVQQLPLAARIPALTQMIDAARARKQQDQEDEDRCLDLLAQAEAEIAGKAPGSEGVEPSGYLESNPYVATGEEPLPEGEQEGQAPIEPPAEEPAR